jgi:osmotically-inducible protein OsmY
MRCKSDEEILGAIRNAWSLNPAVHESNLRVDVINGYARLTGVVGNMAEKLAAANDAFGTEGVLGVENRLVISADKELSDLEIERAASDLLEQNGLAYIGARVEAGNVFLQGVVESLAIGRQAVQLAESVKGVRGIYSELSIAAGEPVDDIKLANNVTEALSLNPSLSFTDLRVCASEGTVEISGGLRNEEQQKIAAETAMAVPGVQKLQNCTEIRRAAA